MAFRRAVRRLGSDLTKRAGRARRGTEQDVILGPSAQKEGAAGIGYQYSSTGHHSSSTGHHLEALLSSRENERKTEDSCQELTSNALQVSKLASVSRGTWRNYEVAGALSSARFRSESEYMMQSRWISSSPRTYLEQMQASSTTARSSQVPAPSDEEQVKKPKEASAAECDQAVEGLSAVKARVQAANEAVKKGEGVLRASVLLVAALFSRLWQIILGIPSNMKAVASMSRKDWARKLGEWKKITIDTLQHYWVGTKLLWADIRISSRLMMKLINGKSLTRRERQQLTRTAADIFRLVPFAIFILVPFMEFALPLALRLFPNMLPSTFQDKMKEEEKLKRTLKARLEMAKFLQDTVGEMAKEVKKKRSGDIKQTAEALQTFMTKVRTGGRVTNEEILSFAKVFNDELTLDNISRPRLVSMCKYMGLQTFGTDAYLRYILRAKLAWIKEDDKMIQAEGVESLTESELRAAARERGMMGLLRVEEMRQQLRDWLDLSLNQAVPSSLLILSRAFLVGSKVKREEGLSFTLSSLPDTLVEQVGAAVPEDTLAERRRKLEELKAEEKLIKEEEAEEAARRKLEEEESSRDVALEEMQAATQREAQEEREVAKAKAVSRKAAAQRDDLCKISAALATLAAGSSVAKERADFLRMVNKEIQLYNNMVAKEGTDGEAEARAAYRAAHQAAVEAAGDSGSEASNLLIGKVDSMLHKLEKELDAVDEKIGTRWKILDTDHDGKVTPEEVAAAAAFLKSSLGDVSVQELISNLAKDQDGKILVEDIVRLGTMEDRHEESNHTPQQAH